MTTNEQDPSVTNSWVFGHGLDGEGPSIDADGFATRAEAIAAGRASYTENPDHDLTSESFQTGFQRWMTELPPTPFDADRVIEDAVENAEWPEQCVENWSDDAGKQSADLQTKLDALWHSWCDEHNLHQTMYQLDDVDDHAVVVAEDVATKEAV